MTSARVLTHYDPSLQINLAAFASSCWPLPLGLGRSYPMCLQMAPKSQSRRLSSSERNYAQIEKEALSLIFGGRNFVTICMAIDSSLLQLFLVPRKVYHHWLLLAFSGGPSFYLHTSMTFSTSPPMNTVMLTASPDCPYQLVSTTIIYWCCSF